MTDTRTGDPGQDETFCGSGSPYRVRMLVLVTTVILYVAGFVFLYGVIRLGVRHGIEDAEANRPEALRRAQLAVAHDQEFRRENAFLSQNN